MQKLIPNFILLLLVVGCRFGDGRFLNDYKSKKIMSPTRKYYLTSSVNRTDKAKGDFADVIIHLYSSEGRLLSDFNTHAGDASKWAIGWEKIKDTIVLFSSDIGNIAYKIENGQLKAISLTDELNKRARELKQDEYK